MPENNVSQDIYFLLNILLLIFSVVAIVIGILINDFIPLIVGILWLLISSLRLFILINRDKKERQPLIVRV